MLALTASEILTIRNFDLENLGRRSPSTFAAMPFGNEYRTSVKVMLNIFMLAFTVSDILRIKMFDLENVEGHRTFAVDPFDDRYQFL